MRAQFDGRPNTLLVFVDLETGGFDRDDEILQIAYIVTDPTGRKTLARAVEKIKPEHPERIKAAAAAINGYNAQDWADAPPLRDVMERMVNTVSGLLGPFDSAQMVAHNSPFDIPRIEAAVAASGLRMPRGGHHSLDTASIAWPLIKQGKFAGQGLETLCITLGIKRDRPHDAMSDTEDCRRVYVACMEVLTPLHRRVWTRLTSAGERVQRLARHVS